MSRTTAQRVQGVELGLGLIGIGRPWPTPDAAVCTAEQAWTLLDRALELNIRFFDTAAAYGRSEAVLGEYLGNLPAVRREELLIATKCGETWPTPAGAQPDHSLVALEMSFERSHRLLGRIDLLQLHKCTVDDLRDDHLLAWFEGLRASGEVGAIGVSVSSEEALRAALDTAVFDTVQFPANSSKPDFTAAFAEAERSHLPLLNRPMASGALADTGNPFVFHTAAFQRAVVLTGTTQVSHLEANAAAFASAMAAATTDQDV
ncbi:aldo/keto reductase [Streptomyces sp. AC602_WCS936]|uniref:aldo/keto reductase n=1 Tax=Streptomyces sp. AC602_WCS936 TaxID=2823685 RepID=UPI001C253845|nr:aldo/keto reductase [Streptomyces sp. AC602_WCS936]